MFKTLNIGLTEVPDWFCCGATPAHNVDELLSLSLCAKNLALAEKVEGDLAVACAACFSRLKTTQHPLKATTSANRWKTPSTARCRWASVKHLLEILARDLGLERLEETVKKPLAGLKVACYYGCLLTRPPEVPELDCVEAPTIMENVLQAVGAEAVAWSHRLECCGANFTLSRPGVVVKLSHAILESAERPAPIASWWPAPCATATWTSASRRSKRPTARATACRSSTSPSWWAWLPPGSGQTRPGRPGRQPLPLLKEKGLL